MPLSYGDGTIAEHKACRTGGVVFDVSHLGTVRVEGSDALARLQAALTNDLGKVAPGRAQYTHLLDEADASVLDDIIVWWLDDEVFDVMPNASNTERVVAAIGGEDVTAIAGDHRGAGPGRPRAPGHHRARGRRHRSLPGRRRRGGRRRVHGRRHRLHGRGRRGARGPGRRGARGVGGAARHRPGAGRARRPRHAAPRGGAPAPRPRARPGHHARCRPGSAGSWRGTRTGASVAARRWSPSGSAAWPVASAASRSRAAARPGPSRPCSSTAAEAGVVTSGNFSPMLGPRHRARPSSRRTSRRAPRWPSTCEATRCRRGSSRPRSSPRGSVPRGDPTGRAHAKDHDRWRWWRCSRCSARPVAATTTTQAATTTTATDDGGDDGDDDGGDDGDGGDDDGVDRLADVIDDDCEFLLAGAFLNPIAGFAPGRPTATSRRPASSSRRSPTSAPDEIKDAMSRSSPTPTSRCAEVLQDIDLSDPRELRRIPRCRRAIAELEEHRATEDVPGRRRRGQHLDRRELHRRRRRLGDRLSRRPGRRPSRPSPGGVTAPRS